MRSAPLEFESYAGAIADGHGVPDDFPRQGLYPMRKSAKTTALIDPNSRLYITAEFSMWTLVLFGIV